jgi:TRAP-type C4-dicarboxylate transport system substrate-binding protein
MRFGFTAWSVAALLAASAAIPARAEEPVTLKFGFPAPVTSYVNTEGMTPWLEQVEKASGGTLKIKLFAGPTLGTFRDIYERTLSGVSQISFGVFGPLASQFPRTQVTGLPFLSDNTKISSVALWRLYAKGLLKPEYDKVKVLALFNFPSSTLNTTKPVKTIDDVKGMKIAVSSRTLGEVAAALGGSPVTLTPTELYQGMSRGVVDAVFVAWTAVKTFKLDEVTQYHLEAPVGEAPAYVFMHKATYDGLPAKAKEAIDKLSGESFSERLGANNQAADDEEAKVVAAKPDQEVSRISQAQVSVWKARLKPVIDQWIKTTPDGAKVYSAYEDELKRITAAK